MASFDKSFYDLLNRYSSIHEQQATIGESAATPEEAALFRKLHGVNYTPGAMNDAKLAQLRTAGEQVGGFNDVEKVRNAAYAQQYAGTPQGTAYAKKAGIQSAATPGATPGNPASSLQPGLQSFNEPIKMGLKNDAPYANAPLSPSAPPSAAAPTPSKQAQRVDYFGNKIAVATPDEQSAGVPAGSNATQRMAMRSSETPPKYSAVDMFGNRKPMPNPANTKSTGVASTPTSNSNATAVTSAPASRPTSSSSGSLPTNQSKKPQQQGLQRRS